MQFRTGAVIAILALISLAPIEARGQSVLYDGLLESYPNKTTIFRNKATNAGAAQVSDSTDWIDTDGWTRATVQHVGTDTYALDSVSYTLFVRWSNNGTTAFLSDSLPFELTESSHNLDTLIIRAARYVRFCLYSPAQPATPWAAANYATVRVHIVAKGEKP